MKLKDKLILITGASRGIGRAVALACAKEGAELVITARTTAALEELDDEIQAIGGRSAIVEMDLTDRPAVGRLAAAIASRWGRLDGFVANAGQLGQLAPLPHSDPDIFDRTLQINLSAVYDQIKALDPLLRRSEAGRAVLVSSSVAVHNRAFWGAYAISKAGLEAMGRIWAEESEQTHMKINMLDPGGTATAMRASAFPGEDADTLPSPADIAPAFISLLSAECTYHGATLKARELAGL
ncbi:MAG: SDR family NAD(P)-dependent oxidoreductase [Candidatus Puniceispirillaceae bacterium]